MQVFKLKGLKSPMLQICDLILLPSLSLQCFSKQRSYAFISQIRWIVVILPLLLFFFCLLFFLSFVSFTSHFLASWLQPSSPVAPSQALKEVLLPENWWTADTFLIDEKRGRVQSITFSLLSVAPTWDGTAVVQIAALHIFKPLYTQLDLEEVYSSFPLSRQSWRFCQPSDVTAYNFDHHTVLTLLVKSVGNCN